MSSIKRPRTLLAQIVFTDFKTEFVRMTVPADIEDITIQRMLSDINARLFNAGVKNRESANTLLSHIAAENIGWTFAVLSPDIVWEDSVCYTDLA